MQEFAVTTSVLFYIENQFSALDNQSFWINLHKLDQRTYSAVHKHLLDQRSVIFVDFVDKTVLY